MTIYQIEEFERLLHQRAREVLPDADISANAAIYNVLRFANVLGQDLESQLHRPNGSTRAGFRIMLVVWTLGPQTQKALAHYANVTPSSISSVLNNLEEGGLIFRNRAKTDRRTVNVALTNQGVASVSHLYKLQLQREAEWLSALAETDKQSLLRICQELLRNRPSRGVPTEEADSPVA
jgi:DNA-binding MarR family transcriptional regulator